GIQGERPQARAEDDTMHVPSHLVRRSLLSLLGLLVWTGCAGNSTGPSRGTVGQSSTAGSQTSVNNAGTPEHTHERGKMLIADAGNYHALLTAHLSLKDGNELDIFFETAEEKNPTPVAIPLESFTAYAQTGEGDLKELEFECAPARERPEGEKSG